jgi:hypothetical protein
LLISITISHSSILKISVPVFQSALLHSCKCKVRLTKKIYHSTSEWLLVNPVPGGLFPEKQIFAVRVALVSHRAPNLPHKNSTRRLKRTIIVSGTDFQAARGRRKRPKDQIFCAPSPESTHRLKKTNNFKTQVFDRKNTQTHPNKFASYVGRCPVIIKSTCDRPAGRRGPKTVAKEAGEIADSHSSQPTTLCRFRALSSVSSALRRLKQI